MVDTLAIRNYDENMPRIAAVHSYTKTVDRFTRSEMAMANANLTTINSYRTLQSSNVSTKDYTEVNSWNHSASSVTEKGSESLDGICYVTSKTEDSVQSRLSTSTENCTFTPSTTSVSSVISSLSSSTFTCISDVSVRASSTHTSMVTTTTTSTKSLAPREVPLCSRERKNTAVTYCYDVPNSMRNKLSTVKTKSNKIPYKVVGKRYIDERKFARLLWRKIKDMDFPLAFAEILSQIRRVDALGIGVCRDRLLKLLKVMIQSKRGKCGSQLFLSE